MGFAQEAIVEAPMMVKPFEHLSPVTLVAVSAAAGASLLNIKKITPHWHHTINEGEIGVWLKRGSPILTDNFTAQDVIKAEAEDPFSNKAHYKVAHENWYFVPPFRTLQTVDVADQPLSIKIPIDTEDNVPQQLALHANFTWRVKQDGDNPVRAITRVKHLKTDKKDGDANKDAERREPLKVHPLEGQVSQICTVGLGKVLSGRSASELKRLTFFGSSEAEQVELQAKRDQVAGSIIESCKRQLIYYGVDISRVDFVPAVRSDAEVQAQALRSLSAGTAAIAAAASHEATPEFTRSLAETLAKQEDSNVILLNPSQQNSTS